MPLTALQVKNAKPGRHADGKGLYLLVKPSGARSWVLRVQGEGRRRDFGLGSVDLVSLAEAREKALEGRRMVKAGIDPAQEWKRKTVVVPTFEAFTREYHAGVKSGWKNEDDRRTWLAQMETYVFPIIGRKTVDEIDAVAIREVLIPIWTTKHVTADRIKQRIGAILDAAHGDDLRATGAPIKAAVARLPKRQKVIQNYPALPFKDLPAFMAKMRSQAPSLGRLACIFTILTAARPIEVRKARWREVDLDAATWTIPPENLKRKIIDDYGKPVPHVVPLSSDALDLLRQMAGLFGGDPDAHLFPGKKGQPISEYTAMLAFKGCGAGEYTIHGTARSSFRDWVAEKCPTVPGDVAEAALAHTVRNRTEAAYRRTRYLEQRRPLMQAWGSYLSGESNVLRLAAG